MTSAESNHILQFTDEWTTNDINKLIQKNNYQSGSKSGDELILIIACHSKIDPSWLEDFALSGKHPIDVVKQITLNPICDEWLLEELYRRKDSSDWKQIDDLVLKHNNCPKSLIEQSKSDRFKEEYQILTKIKPKKKHG